MEWACGIAMRNPYHNQGCTQEPGGKYSLGRLIRCSMGLMGQHHAAGKSEAAVWQLQEPHLAKTYDSAKQHQERKVPTARTAAGPSAFVGSLPNTTTAVSRTSARHGMLSKVRI
jgi:hypothetical protein